MSRATFLDDLCFTLSVNTRLYIRASTSLEHVSLEDVCMGMNIAHDVMVVRKVLVIMHHTNKYAQVCDLIVTIIYRSSEHICT